MIWVVHPDPRIQRFLARLAGEVETLCGDLTEEVFAGSPAPEAIVLAVADPDRALDFVHRFAVHHVRSRWVLIHDVGVGESEVRARFAGLNAELLSFPPDPPALRAALRRATSAEAGETLADRRRRDALATRFARYFQDLDLPETDQVQLAGRGLVVRGESGTGRLLFARAAHVLAGGEAFVHLPCDTATRAEDLADRLAPIHEARGLTICLEGLDQVSVGVQRELLGWIELGVPGSPLTPSAGAEGLRWMALISASGALLPELADGLAAFEVDLPPLRERPHAVIPFARATTEQWAQAKGLERRFSEEALASLEGELWPGNFRELESVVLRLLAAARSNEIGVNEVSGLLGQPGLERRPDLPSVSAQRETASVSQPTPSTSPATPPPALPVADAGTEPTAVREETAPTPSTDPSGAPIADFRQLAAALSHELRNPLVSIRTFAELLPERFSDPEFRASFREHVRHDLSLLEQRLASISRFAEMERGDSKPVDVTALLDQLLAARSEEIRERRLLVLRELESEAPHVLGQLEGLTFVFECLFSVAMAGASDRADLYLASHRHRNAAGQPALRILFRFHDGSAGGARATQNRDGGLQPISHSLDLWLAESGVATMGGNLRVDMGEANETVILIDLPAPA